MACTANKIDLLADTYNETHLFMEETMVTVISLGGSIVAPSNPDTAFLSTFVETTRALLEKNPEMKLIFVIGGGGPARTYQQAYKAILGTHTADNSAADWIGIMATRLNAELVKAAFGDLVQNPVVYNPTLDVEFSGRILVAAGWKPGFSTDNDAVLLAEKYKATRVINLSNIEKVYTADPRKDPTAKALDTINWDDFLKMTGTTWEPGKNVPFDPVASLKAKEMGLTVICADGKNIANLHAILQGKDFIGTTIQ